MNPAPLIPVCIALAASIACATSPIEQLHDPTWGVSQAEVRASIASFVEHTESLTIETPLLPLASESESYLVAHNLTTISDEQIDRVTYTFADNALVMITASGNAIDVLIDSPRDLPNRIGDWRLSDDMSVVMHRASDTVTMLSEDAKHPHLFLWAIPDPQSADSSDPMNASIPDLFSFGTERRELEPALKALCVATTREQIDPPTLPTQPKRQTQINAYGFEYLGVPRKVEAIFADDKLTLVWILTGKDEEDRIREALIESYGDPIFVSDTIEAFNNWSVALRKDKPEVLAIAPELVPMMKSYFGDQ